MILLKGIFGIISLIFAAIAATHIQELIYQYRQVEMRQVLESLPNVKKLPQFISYEGVNAVEMESIEGFAVGFNFSDSNGRFGRPEDLHSIDFDGLSPRCENPSTNNRIEIIEHIGLKQPELGVRDFQTMMSNIPQVVAFMNENYGPSRSEAKMLSHQGMTYECFIENMKQ
jgi:hypothetical protein